MPVSPFRGRVPARKSRPLTKTQRLYFERLLLNVRALQEENAFEYDVAAVVPEAWDTLEHDVDVTERKVKVTLRMDESVAKFYRAMGQGYQARINRVLATFAQMRIAEVERFHKELDADMAKMEAELAEMQAER